MSESIQDANDNKPHDSPGEEDAIDLVAEDPQPSLRRAVIGLLVAIAITAILQYFAPDFDHQKANLISLACILVASIYFLVCLHRIQRRLGNRWHVPLGIIATALVCLIGFRFEGFSGEMLPQFALRFASEANRKLVPLTIAETTETETSDLEQSDTEPDTLSRQFLGPDRNGVYPKRFFKVPTSPSDVKVVWDQGIGNGWSSFAVANGQAITMEQRADREWLTSYRISDGALIWAQTHEGIHRNPLGGIGPRSTPTIEGDKVYATTATGFLWCARLQTGDVIWTKDLLQLAGWDQIGFEAAASWGYAGSPLLVDGQCVVPLGGPLDATTSASLVAMDAESGEVLWKAGDDQLSYASPILATIDGERQIVSVNEKTVSGHLVADGKQIWSFDWPGSTNTSANCSSAVPVLDNRLLVGKGYGGGSALVEIIRNESGWMADDVWRSNRVLKTKFNHTCVQGDTGYGISNGSLQAVDLNDATVYWNQPRRSRAAQGQVVLVEDVLVVQDESGDVVFVDASVDGYNELFRMPALDSKTWNIPSVAGRYLLVRNDHQAICFELPER
jgi:hypothetical protein